MRIADFLDWLYPTVESLSEEEQNCQQQRQQDRLQFVETHTDPEALAKGYAELCAEETERLKSVETRLGSVLGLTSITSSLLIGGIFAIVNGGLSDSSRSIRFFACAALVYLSLQIICSTLAAILGLGRASWIGRSIEDYVANSAVEPVEQHRQTALRNCKRLLQMEDNINAKVTQMAVAHAAIRNFASASVLIAVLGCFAVLLQQPGNTAAKAIRANPDIQRLLQGPPGPQGPRGPKGDTGEPASTSHHGALTQKVLHR
jgi:hypothetical protein